MKIRPLWIVGGMVMLAIPLMGMKCTATAGAKVSCKQGKCTKSANVGIQGSWDMVKSLAMGAHMNLAGSYDAALYTVDVSQSTVTVPSHGNVTVKLMNSSTGAVLASRTFGWTRTGATIRLSDPGAVNVWAQQNGSGADAVKYQMAPFTTSQSQGLNTLTMTDEYDGEIQASASTTWRGPQCPLDPVSSIENGGRVHPDMRYCGPRNPQ